jgi:hypothetical protein
LPQETQQRLDVLFPFNDTDPVQAGLRALTRLAEARLAALEAQRADYAGVIDALTAVALTRINDVLLPALPVLDEIIRAGFGADRILDAGPTGLALIRSTSPAQARTAAGAASAADLDSILERLNNITSGADPLLDSFFEIANELRGDTTAITNLMTATANRLRTDAAQGLTSGQKGIALGNLGLSTFGRDLVQKATASDWLAALGASELGKSLLAAATAAALRSTAGLAGRTGGNDITFAYDSLLTASAGGVDQGAVWTNANNFRQAQYMRLANGVILQWMDYAIAADKRVQFPVAFTSAVFTVQLTVSTQPGTNQLYTAHVDQPTLDSFDIRVREYNSVDGARPNPDQRNIKMFAMGI